MIARKLVELIEKNADELAKRVIKRATQHPGTQTFYYVALGYENALISGKAELKPTNKKEQKEFKELRRLVLPWWP